MSETELLNRVSILPGNLKTEVSDYVNFLTSKYLNKESSGKPLKFGMMKGTFEMKSDFDEPLDDLLDALLVEERKSEDTISFDEFVNQLKAEGKIDQ